MTVENGVQASKPTIWYRLGFHYGWDEALFNWRSADPEPDDWFVAGALTTRIEVHVGFLDRIRLLISGRCELFCSTRTDVVVKRAETRSQFAVLPPKKRPTQEAKS